MIIYISCHVYYSTKTHSYESHGAQALHTIIKKQTLSIKNIIPVIVSVKKLFQSMKNGCPYPQGTLKCE
jgi:hypothetical protein